MCSFDLALVKNNLKREYDILFYSAQTEQSRDTFVSNGIVEAIINSYGNEQVSLYYSHVTEKVCSLGSELILDVVEHKTDYIAETTNYYSRKININFSSESIFLGELYPNGFASDGNTADLRYVFVHELGEAEYLTEQYCRIYDTSDRQTKRRPLNPILMELFSHTYINRNLENFGLSEFIDYNRGDNALNVNYLEGGSNWESFIDIIHMLASYPFIYERRKNIVGYSNFCDEIDAVMDILQNLQLFESMENVKDASYGVINVLTKVGLTGLQVIDV